MPPAAQVPAPAHDTDRVSALPPWLRAAVPGTSCAGPQVPFTNAVSCAAAGTCSAGGFYFDGSGHRQAFVVTEVNGTWGTAQEVPGTAALNQGGNAETLSVSCAGAGTCAAGGIYTDSSGHHQAFVVTKA